MVALAIQTTAHSIYDFEDEELILILLFSFGCQIYHIIILWFLCLAITYTYYYLIPWFIYFKFLLNLIKKNWWSYNGIYFLSYKIKVVCPSSYKTNNKNGKFNGILNKLNVGIKYLSKASLLESGQLYISLVDALGFHWEGKQGILFVIFVSSNF